MLAGTELSGYVVDGALSAGQLLHQHASNAGGAAVICFHHRQASLQLRLEELPHGFVSTDERSEYVLFGKFEAVSVADGDGNSDKNSAGMVLHRLFYRCGQRHNFLLSRLADEANEDFRKV